MKLSAGLLLYRNTTGQLEVLLVHPGGPFWKKKDLGAWSIPKGEYNEPEDALTAARREFKEETGMDVDGNFLVLKPVKQKSGKLVHAFALAADIDAAKIVSNTFPLEWPPKSGEFIQVPEIDKAEWFTIAEAKQKINAAQLQLVDELQLLLYQHNTL